MHEGYNVVQCTALPAARKSNLQAIQGEPKADCVRLSDLLLCDDHPSARV